MSGVEIRVRSNSTQAQADLRRLERSVAGIERGVSNATKAFRTMAIGITSVFAAGGAVKGINKTTDALTDMQNRIALVTGRGKELTKTMDSIYSISKQTRGSVGASTEVFNRFGIALKGTGASAKEVLKAVESVNKAVAISGTGGESARAALVQLGQGLASGQLRGQELNSVLEQAPRLAQVIADEMEIPLGKLREVAAEGQITSDIVFKGLINQAEALSKEFDSMEATSTQAFGILRDQAGRVTAEISKQLGITEAFTSRANRMSDYLEANRARIVSSVTGTARGIKTFFTNIVNSIKGVANIVRTVVDELAKLAGFGEKPIELVRMGVLEGAAEALGKIVNFLTEAKDDASFVERFMDSIANNVSMLGSGLSRLKVDAIAIFSKWSKIASENMEELYYNAKKFSALKYVSFRGGSGLVSDYKMYLKVLRVQSKAEKSVKSLFNTTKDIAKSATASAWKAVKSFLDAVERKFYWAYDEIIQNSWWTDTMEQTYYLAQKWLGKAGNVVSNFATYVTEKFKSIYEKFSGSSEFKIKMSVDDFNLGGLVNKFKGFAGNAGTLLADGVRTGLETIIAISPAMGALVGTALIAGITKVMSPRAFAATFARVGPLAAFALTAAIFKPLISALSDADAFYAVGVSLGKALGLGLESLVGVLPQLLKAMLNGLAGFGAGLANHLGGIFGGAVEAAFNVIPFGKLLLGALGTAAIGAILSKNIRSVVMTAMRTVGTATAATRAGGIMSVLFLGADATRTQRIVQARGAKMSATTLAQITALGKSAKLAHLGAMGAIYLGSSALLGTFLPADMVAGFASAAAIIGPSLIGLFTAVPGSQRMVNRVFEPIKLAAANLGPLMVNTFAQARLAMAAMQKQGIASVATSKIHSLSWVKGNRLVSLSFNGVIAKLKTMRFLALGSVVALGLMATSALAAGESVNGAATSMTEGLLGLAIAASAIVPLLKGTAIGAALKTSVLAGLAPIGGLITTYLVAPIMAGLASIAAAFFALPAAIGAAIAAIVTIVGGFSIYSLFFGEGDSFSERVKNNFNGLVRSLFALKTQTRSFRKEISRIASSVEANLKGLDVEIDVVANIKKADLRVLTGNQQESLKNELRNLEQLQSQAIREDALYGSVSTELLDKINKSTASIDKKTKATGKVDINESSADRVATTISQIMTGIQTNPNLRGSDLGKEIKDYLRNEQINTGSADGRLAIANQMTGFINQMISSGAIDSDSAMASLLPLFKEVIERGGDVGLKTLDALDGFKAFTRVSAFSGKANALTPDITAAIQESLDDFAIDQIRAQREGYLTLIEDGAKSFGITLPDNLNLLAKADLLELAGTFRKLTAASNDANPDFTTGKSRFIEQEALDLGASQEQIDTLNRTVILAQAAADTMGQLLETVDSGIGRVNERLSSMGMQEIDLGGFVGSLEKVDSITGAVEGYMRNIEGTQISINTLAANTAINEENRLAQNQSLATVLARQKQQLADYLTYANQVGIADNERIGLLQDAIGSMSNLTFDINKVLGVDGETLLSITTAQNKIGTMILLLREMAAAGTDSVRGITKEQASAALEGAQATVKTLLEGTGLGKSKGGGGKTETAIEKFIGKLSDTGFQADLATVAEMSSNQMKKIGKSLNIIDAAQKKINNSALAEVGVRKRALEAINAQRAAIAASLGEGTVGQAQSGMEALGMDPEALNFGQGAVDIQNKLAQLQRDKLALNAEDFEGINAVNNAIEKQTRLYAAMTEQRNGLNTAFTSSLKSNLSDVLKGAKSLSEGIHGVLDTLSSTIIDTVVGSFVDAMVESAGLKDMFGSLFDGLFGSGSSIGDKIGSGIKSAVDEGMSGASGSTGMTGFLGTLGKGFTDILGKLGSGLSGLFSGMGGLFGGGGGGGLFGGGGLGGLFSAGMSIFGFSDGGLVPNTSSSRAGMDSVPAMLTPGELVVPANKIDDVLAGKSTGSTQSFNINVQGDVSRQTRQEIVKMLPQIASGVNMQNKERNYRR
jgi:tape measure domain-containing protein